MPNLTPSVDAPEPIAVANLELPALSGLRERRPSSNLGLGRIPLAPLSSIPGAGVDNIPELHRILEKDFGHAGASVPNPFDKVEDVTVIQRGDEVHVLGAVTPEGRPSVPPTPSYVATPGNLTPSLTRTADFERRELLPPPRKAERYKLRLAAALVSFFSCGWADGTPGTIIPHLEEGYHLSHFTVSLLFVFSATGFAIGTIIVEPLMLYLGKFSPHARHRTFLPKLFSLPPFTTAEEATPAVIGHSISQGRLLTVLVGCVCQSVHYSIAVTNPSFWALCVAFSFGGVAISIFTGQMNAYVAGASVRTQGRALGTLHGFYGLGAFASPLVCQTLLARGWPWHQYYWLSFGLSITNIVFMTTAFHTTPTEFEYEKQQALELAQANQESVEMQPPGGPAPASRTSNINAIPKGTMRVALSLPYVWLFMAFLGFYTGSETTMGGWVVTYLLDKRNANPDTVGYVASGFWGGLAAGRLILGHASPYIGIRREKHLVHVYIGVSLLMTILIWFIPSFIGNAVFAACIGWCLGPIFPTSLSLATKILPKEVHLTALAAMSSMASIGSAVFPFFAGILASAKGVVYVQPFMCGILGVMGTLWCFFPSRVGMAA